ncbi:MAG: DUF6691 family protein [Saprospiraceae bacterium]
MKYLKFLIAGIIFGIILAKAEVISWYRIYEMFRFESFHMYGIIGCAVAIGLIATQLFKRSKIKDINGNEIVITDKPKIYKANLIGGVIFGLGWAMTGACPGPLFILLGYGFPIILIVILGALLGSFVYGILKPKLPH